MSKNTIFPNHNKKNIFNPPLTVFICCALLTAVGVVLKTVSFNISLGNIMLSRIGFQLLPTYIASILFGPFLGAVVGFLTDLFSMLIFPVGAYTPFYGITFIMGAIYAWSFFNIISFKPITGSKFDITFLFRVLLTVLTVQIVVLLLNTCWNAMLYGTNDTTFPLFLLSRCPSMIFYVPVFTVALYVLLPVLAPFANRFYKRKH